MHIMAAVVAPATAAPPPTVIPPPPAADIASAATHETDTTRQGHQQPDSQHYPQTNQGPVNRTVFLFQMDIPLAGESKKCVLLINLHAR
jgi:hypothetical protein